MQNDEIREAINGLQSGETASVRIGDRIAFFAIGRYDRGPNPLTEREGNGSMWSLRSDDPNFDPAAVRSAIATDPDAVDLSYYSGSPSFWFPRGATLPTVPYDRSARLTELAGVWVPDCVALDEIDSRLSPKQRKAALFEYALGVCDVYNKWRNGQVYSFKCVAYQLERDAESRPIMARHLYEDHPCLCSTGLAGYYDLNELKEEAYELVLADLGEARTERGSICGLSPESTHLSVVQAAESIARNAN